VARA
jgi:hypothetical protein